MSRCWWREPVRSPKSYDNYLWIYRVAMAWWWMRATVTRSCFECGRRKGKHKMSCDTGVKARRQKRLMGGLDG